MGRTRGRHVPPPDDGAPGDATAVAEERARLALRLVWVWLGLIVVLRAALAVLPGMGGWGLGLQRFLSASDAWPGWALCAASLIPSIGRPATALLERAGNGIATRPHAAAAILAALLMSVVWLRPDEAHFTGDFLMRLGALGAGVNLGLVFPQAMPLDLFLHHRLPLILMAATGVDAQTAVRVLALPWVAALGVTSVGLARVLDLRGTAAAAAVSIVAFGGWLALFTGLGKPFGELCVLTLATVALAARMVRRGRGHLALGVALALGFWLHRAALALLLPALAAWLMWLRSSGPAWRPGTVAGAVIPLAGLGAAAPRLLQAIAGSDARNFLPQGAAGIPAATLAPLHLLDVLNVALLLSPWILLLPAIAVVLFPLARRRPEVTVMGALAAPAAGLLLSVHPPQGAFRDWDLFAPSGIALAAVAAWLIGIALMRTPGRSWLAAAVVLAAVVPSLQWLSHLHRVDAALHRVEAFVLEAPLPPKEVRAVTYSYLGIRYSALSRLDASAEAWGRAATLAPSPRFLVNRAVAEEARGHLQAARDAYLQAIERAPNTYEAWLGLAQVALAMGRLDEAAQAARRAAAMRPSAPDPPALLDAVSRRQQAAPVR